MNLRHYLPVMTGIVIAMGSVNAPVPAHAQPYFEGKTMTMVLETAPGGRRDRLEWKPGVLKANMRLGFQE